jgi:hypothetical protein
MKETVLVGKNTFTAHPNASFQLITELGYTPSWPQRPYTLNNTIPYDPSGFPRQQTVVGAIDITDTHRELTSSYSTKSMMSLDGIFSPISFYPTPHGSTFSITKYPTHACPFCFGTKSYTYELLNDNITISPTEGIDDIVNKKTSFNVPCPFCENVSEKIKRSRVSAGDSAAMPPYVLASGTDLELITARNSGVSGGSPIINYATLNPIVLSYGEFSNFQNKQSGDFTGHSVNLVSFGFIPPGPGDSLVTLGSKNINRNYADYDINFVEWKGSIPDTIANTPPLSNNMRFFGLRGPVMLHSWGYDLEGFPVPNSSGEPLVMEGRVVVDSSGNIVGKNQQATAQGWSKPFKEETFYKGWAQSPASWPVGPIDFRWDENAGVWTIGSNYKAVHIILEEDLVSSEPVRGTLLNQNFINDPLPSGLRRLVFVRDLLRDYSAPRGASMYCRYDAGNGFYEPIGQRTFITSGTIISQNTVNIYGVYRKPNELEPSDRPELERYETTYSNPLNLPTTVGTLTLFTFLKGQWTIIAGNCT